jgi:hypothetical protein
VTIKEIVTQNKQLIFYKIMPLSCLMYGSETWTVRRKDKRQLEATKVRFQWNVAGYTPWDKE